MNPPTLRDLALQGKPLASALVIDFHVHLTRWTVSYCPAPGEKMFAAMDRAGVAMICVNDMICPDIREGNDRVAAFTRRFPNRVIPIASLNPYQGNMLDEVKRCVEELGMRGLKVHNMIQGLHSPDPLDASYGWNAVWKYCAQHHLPVLAHGIVTDNDIRQNPETVFVIAHGISSPDRMGPLRDCPNVYVDTAATGNRTWSLPLMVKILGTDRILWGTDAPLNEFAQRLGVVLDSGLSEEDQRKILGLNAARLLQIPA